MPKDGVVGDVDGSFPLGRALADHSDLAAPPKMQWEINSRQRAEQWTDSRQQGQTADSKDQYKLYSGQQTTVRIRQGWKDANGEWMRCGWQEARLGAGRRGRGRGRGGG